MSTQAASRFSTGVKAQWQELFAHSPVMSIMADSGGAVLAVSDFGAAQLGYAVGDLVGESVLKVCFSDDKEAVRQNLELCVRTPGRRRTWEGRKVRRDGTMLWARESAQAVRGPDGNPIVLITCEDISDRKRAEALFAGEKQILEMVASGAALTQVLDSLCRFVEEQVPGMLASVLLLEGGRLRHGGAPSLPKAYIDAIDGALIGPSAGSCGTAAFTGKQVIVADIASDPLWADYRELALPHSLRACWSTPVLSPENQVIATFAMYYREPRSPGDRDQEVISQIAHLAGVAVQHERAEQAVQASEKRFRAIIEHAYDVVFLVSAEGKLLYVSPSVERVLGYSSKELIGQSGYDVIHPDHRHEAGARFAVAMKEPGAVITGERLLLRKDGSTLWAETVLVNLLAEPSVQAAVVHARDISERKGASEALRGAQAELAHANRVTTMGQLTASIAHEVNQPIAATLTNAQAALRWLDAKNVDEARQALGRIVRDAGRAGDVVERIRNLSRRSVRREDRVEINGAIRDVIELTRSEAIKSGISVRTEFVEDRLLVQGDRVELQQVMLNLILNAVEAMRGSEKPRELLIRTSSTEAGEALVAVRDTGPGLAPAIQENLFRAFTTTKPSGLGLGLSICRSIIEGHGGRLWASANAPRGAVFQFTLPARSRTAPSQ
jgi:PAS domain S-box-containing protein